MLKMYCNYGGILVEIYEVEKGRRQDSEMIVVHGTRLDPDSGVNIFQPQ